MAQKRMFDRSIIDTDKFMDLPVGAKALYFLLGLEADDYGFVTPRRVMKLHNITEDDLKILITKGYLIPFKTGVVIITDWNKNNWLDKRRIKQTEYTEELKMLITIDNTYVLTSAKPMLSKCSESLEESSIEESSIEESSLAKNDDDETDLQPLVKKYGKVIINKYLKKAKDYSIKNNFEIKNMTAFIAKWIEEDQVKQTKKRFNDIGKLYD